MVLFYLFIILLTVAMAAASSPNECQCFMRLAKLTWMQHFQTIFAFTRISSILGLSFILFNVSVIC